MLKGAEKYPSELEDFFSKMKNTAADFSRPENVIIFSNPVFNESHYLPVNDNIIPDGLKTKDGEVVGREFHFKKEDHIDLEEYLSQDRSNPLSELGPREIVALEEYIWRETAESFGFNFDTEDYVISAQIVDESYATDPDIFELYEDSLEDFSELKISLKDFDHYDTDKSRNYEEYSEVFSEVEEDLERAKDILYTNMGRDNDYMDCLDSFEIAKDIKMQIAKMNRAASP